MFEFGKSGHITEIESAFYRHCTEHSGLVNYAFCWTQHEPEHEHLLYNPLSDRIVFSSVITHHLALAHSSLILIHNRFIHPSIHPMQNAMSDVMSPKKPNLRPARSRKTLVRVETWHLRQKRGKSEAGRGNGNPKRRMTKTQKLVKLIKTDY
jgi:hypothetical protein